VRRRRNWATVVLAALAVLSIALGLAFERAETSAREMHIAQTLVSNEAMVRLAGAAISDKLQGAVRRVEEEASNRPLRELLGQLASARNEQSRVTVREAIQRHLDQVLVGEQSRIQSWAVADRDGYLWARAPYDSAVIGQNYKYREWFNGRVEVASDARITAAPRAVTGFSLAFTSTASNHPLVIGLASPIFAVNATPPDGAIVGVLNAGIQLQTFNRWLEVAENPPGDAGCPDRFVLLLHRTQLIRHPCPGAGAATLPVNGFSADPAVESLLKAAGRKSASFRDPLRSASGAPAKPALAVAWSLETLPDWTLILEEDVDAALRPITALTRNFHGPAHVAFALGAVACVPLAALLWQRRRKRVNPGPESSSPVPN